MNTWKTKQVYISIVNPDKLFRIVGIQDAPNSLNLKDRKMGSDSIY